MVFCHGELRPLQTFETQRTAENSEVNPSTNGTGEAQQPAWGTVDTGTRSRACVSGLIQAHYGPGLDSRPWARQCVLLAFAMPTASSESVTSQV